jgi:transposase
MSAWAVSRANVFAFDPSVRVTWAVQSAGDVPEIPPQLHHRLGHDPAALFDDLPKARWLLCNSGYDADWFRDALQAKGIQPCIPGRRSRNEPVRYDDRSYRRRSRIEIMFGRLKDWRRVATRYDRCSKRFFSAIALAATSSSGYDR